MGQQIFLWVEGKNMAASFLLCEDCGYQETNLPPRKTCPSCESTNVFYDQESEP